MSAAKDHVGHVDWKKATKRSEVEKEDGVSNNGEARVYTVAEAAHEMKVSRSLVWKLVAKEEIAAIRIGKRVLIPRRELDRLLGERGDTASLREPVA